jgi:putative redox protein
MTRQVEASWVGPDLRLLGETSHGSAVIIDHVIEEGTRNQSGPAPMELLLLSIGGCTLMDVVSILKKKRQRFSRLSVQVTGDRAEEHPKIFTQIHVKYLVTGRGIDAKAVERAIELSQTKYCSVSAMLRQAAQITTSYQVVSE